MILFLSDFQYTPFYALDFRLDATFSEILAKVSHPLFSNNKPSSFIHSTHNDLEL